MNYLTRQLLNSEELEILIKELTHRLPNLVQLGHQILLLGAGTTEHIWYVSQVQVGLN